MTKAPEKHDYPDLTDDEFIEFQEFARHIDHFHKLKKNPLEHFDENGMVEVHYLENGRKYLQDMISYFETQDEGYCYQICAQLVKVLEEYNKKFKS